MIHLFVDGVDQGPMETPDNREFLEYAQVSNELSEETGTRFEMVVIL